MGFLDQIREALQPDEEMSGRYQRLLSESDATPSGAMLQSDINRDVLPGRKSRWAGEVPPTEAARLDRFAWGRQAGLGGLPTALYSELVKVPPIQGAMRQVTRGIGKVTGFPEAEEWYDTDETSSPPSLGNVASYVRGAMTPDARSLPEQIRNILIGRR